MSRQTIKDVIEIIKYQEMAEMNPALYTAHESLHRLTGQYALVWGAVNMKYNPESYGLRQWKELEFPTTRRVFHGVDFINYTTPSNELIPTDWEVLKVH